MYTTALSGVKVLGVRSRSVKLKLDDRPTHTHASVASDGVDLKSDFTDWLRHWLSGVQNNFYFLKYRDHVQYQELILLYLFTVCYCFLSTCNALNVSKYMYVFICFKVTLQGRICVTIWGMEKAYFEVQAQRKDTASSSTVVSFGLTLLMGL